MRQERPSNLAILSIEQEIASEIDLHFNHRRICFQKARKVKFV